MINNIKIYTIVPIASRSTDALYRGTLKKWKMLLRICILYNIVWIILYT